MKVYSEISLRQHDAWSGAVETKQAILDAGREDDFDNLIEELYPDGISETQLNDILWFEEDWIFEMLGISTEEEEEIEEEEEE
jgi:hypothetical protein